MNASDKTKKIEWAITKMNEMAEDRDTEGIERMNNWAYDFARGSNERKDKLAAAYKEAKAKAQAA